MIQLFSLLKPLADVSLLWRFTIESYKLLFLYW
jgi:hypothetical protein